MLGNIVVLDGEYLLYWLALYPFCGNAAGCNGRPTAESFEARIHNVAIVIHLDLKLHNITTRRCTHESCAYVGVVFVKAADITGTLVMIHNILVIASAQDGWQAL